MKVFKLFLFLFSLSFTMSFSQQEKKIKDEQRAKFLLKIPEIVNYPDSAVDEEFVITVFDRDSVLYGIMENMATDNDSIHGAPVKINVLKDEMKTGKSHIVFVSFKDSFDLDLIYDKIKSIPALLITENYPYYKSMLNYNSDSATWELNLHRATITGLEFGEEFANNLNVDEKTDWMQLYEEIHGELVDEKKDLIKKRREIKEKERELEKKKKEVQIIEAELEQKNTEIIKQRHLLDKLKSDVLSRNKELRVKERLIASKENDLRKKQKAIATLNKDIEEKQSNLKEHTEVLKQQKAQINKQFAEIRKQETIILLFLILIGVVLLAVIAMVRAYIIKRKANKALSEKNAIIEEQYKVTNEQKIQIEAQNQHIVDSINYAQKIQAAILPDLSEIQKSLSNAFVLYLPKDIVSGDFFWQSKVDDKIIFVAGDSTGHGVPGAFMSMLGITFLNSIVNQKKITDPAEILNNLRENIINSLKQKRDSSKLKDGMDIAVCSINTKDSTIKFSGANNPMILIRNNEVEVFKGDKMPVAIFEKMVSFSNKEIELKPNDSIYVFSDGIVDQFGGEKGKKFMIKRLKSILVEINHQPMEKQKEIILDEFNKWKGNEDQVDDVVMLGVKILPEVISA